MSDVTGPTRWAEARGERLDRGWFDRRPDAFLRIRHAVPFEFDLGEERTDGKRRFVIAFKEKDGTIERRHFLAFQMPDQDLATLSVLFDMLGMLEGHEGDIPPNMLAHAQVEIEEMRARRAKIIRDANAMTARRP